MSRTRPRVLYKIDLGNANGIPADYRYVKFEIQKADSKRVYASDVAECIQVPAGEESLSASWEKPLAFRPRLTMKPATSGTNVYMTKEVDVRLYGTKDYRLGLFANTQWVELGAARLDLATLANATGGGVTSEITVHWNKHCPVKEMQAHVTTHNLFANPVIPFLKRATSLDLKKSSQRTNEAESPTILKQPSRSLDEGSRDLRSPPVAPQLVLPTSSTPTLNSPAPRPPVLLGPKPQKDGEGIQSQVSAKVRPTVDPYRLSSLSGPEKEVDSTVFTLPSKDTVEIIDLRGPEGTKGVPGGKVVDIPGSGSPQEIPSTHGLEARSLSAAVAPSPQRAVDKEGSTPDGKPLVPDLVQPDTHKPVVVVVSKSGVQLTADGGEMRKTTRSEPSANQEDDAPYSPQPEEGPGQSFMKPPPVQLPAGPPGGEEEFEECLEDSQDGVRGRVGVQDKEGMGLAVDPSEVAGALESPGLSRTPPPTPTTSWALPQKLSSLLGGVAGRWSETGTKKGMGPEGTGSLSSEHANQSVSSPGMVGAWPSALSPGGGLVAAVQKFSVYGLARRTGRAEANQKHNTGSERDDVAEQGAHELAEHGQSAGEGGPHLVLSDTPEGDRLQNHAAKDLLSNTVPTAQVSPASTEPSGAAPPDRSMWWKAYVMSAKMIGYAAGSVVYYVHGAHGLEEVSPESDGKAPVLREAEEGASGQQVMKGLSGGVHQAGVASGPDGPLQTPSSHEHQAPRPGHAPTPRSTHGEGSSPAPRSVHAGNQPEVQLRRGPKDEGVMMGSGTVPLLSEDDEVLTGPEGRSILQAPGPLDIERWNTPVSGLVETVGLQSKPHAPPAVPLPPPPKNKERTNGGQGLPRGGLSAASPRSQGEEAVRLPGFLVDIQDRQPLRSKEAQLSPPPGNKEDASQVAEEEQKTMGKQVSGLTTGPVELGLTSPNSEDVRGATDQKHVVKLPSKATQDLQCRAIDQEGVQGTLEASHQGPDAHQGRMEEMAAQFNASRFFS